MGVKNFLDDILLKRQEAADRAKADKERFDEEQKEKEKSVEETNTFNRQQSRQRRIFQIEVRLNEIEREMVELDRVADQNPPVSLPEPPSRISRGKRRQQANNKAQLSQYLDSFNKFLLPLGTPAAALVGVCLNAVFAIRFVDHTRGLDFLGGNTWLSIAVVIAITLVGECMGYCCFMATLLSLRQFVADRGRFRRLLEVLVLGGSSVGLVSFLGIVIVRLVGAGI